MKLTSLRTYLFLILLSSIAALLACGDEPIEPFSADVQRETDLAIIQEYLDDKGYTGLDTTASGAFYLVLDTGSGLPIKPNDIILMDYIGKLTDEFVFDTSIDTVAANNDRYDSSRVYSPLVFTFTGSGWTLTSFVAGFKEGVTASLKEMNVGGHGLIIMPSELGYGNNFSSSLRNEVLIFEIFPVRSK